VARCRPGLASSGACSCSAPPCRAFLVTDHFGRSTEIAAVLAGWIRDGSLRYREETALRLEDAPTALTTLLSGANMGKMLIHVADADGAPDRG
jgi:NADPH-dependent curcumin reductase CurA